jgi:hypothetical protein
MVYPGGWNFPADLGWKPCERKEWAERIGGYCAVVR